MGQRRLIQGFDREIGLKPKMVHRIFRFMRIVESIDGRRDVDWAAVALDCGFHDQAHFIKDFRAFSGLTPTEYLESKSPYPFYVFIEEPARVWVRVNGIGAPLDELVLLLLQHGGPFDEARVLLRPCGALRYRPLPVERSEVRFAEVVGLPPVGLKGGAVDSPPAEQRGRVLPRVLLPVLHEPWRHENRFQQRPV